jgi:hypothetical protein
VRLLDAPVLSLNVIFFGEALLLVVNQQVKAHHLQPTQK